MRYIIGLLVTLGLIILLIVLLVGGGGKPKVPATSKTLDSYASTNAEARLTIDGPVNAASQHQQVRITIDRDNVTFEHLQGYDGNVVTMQRYANTESAYGAFLSALGHAGFTKGNTDKTVADERGYCPLGDRFVMELRQNEKDIERFWATSCGNPKTYAGNRALTVQLFRAQVPDYDTQIENITL
jgi:hypothetical protein